MDDFSTKVAAVLEEAGKEMLFETLDEEAFPKLEGIVFGKLKETLGQDPEIRWIDHSIKMLRNTFASTFLIKGPNGKDDIRKFTISPEVNQMKFDDSLEQDEGVTGQVLLERNIETEKKK